MGLISHRMKLNKKIYRYIFFLRDKKIQVDKPAYGSLTGRIKCQFVCVCMPTDNACKYRKDKAGGQGGMRDDEEPLLAKKSYKYCVDIKI